MMLSTKTYQGLNALPPSYDRLFAHASAQSFFLSLPWFRNFEKTVLNPGDTALIYGVEKDAPPHDPCGALVVQRTRRKGRLFSFERVGGLANYYTPFYSPIIADDYREGAACINGIAAGLWSDANHWDVCNFHSLDKDSPIFNSMVEAFRRVGMIVQAYFCFGNWYLDVKGRSYREYLESLPSILRETIRRKGRRLEKRSGVSVKIITDVDRASTAIDDYTKVYLASWKKPEPFPHFIPGLIRTCAQMGYLRLGIAYVDREPAAAQLWFVSGGIASIYKLAYNERFANLSIGTVLTARLMQHVMDVDKVAVVDYLTGDDAYKKDWMSDRRERWGIMAFNPRRPKGLLQAVRHVGGRELKRKILASRRMLTPQGKCPPSDAETTSGR
jgi:hypothetical protein